MTHKIDFVGGMVSTKPAGIDIELIKEVPGSLFKRIIDAGERRVFDHYDSRTAFFRAFTSKEAVLKTTGEGIKGLSKARIIKVMDKNNLIVDYHKKKYWVENFYFENYLASVVSDRIKVEWTINTIG